MMIKGVGHLHQNFTFSSRNDIGYLTTLVKNLGALTLTLTVRLDYAELYKKHLITKKFTKKFMVKTRLV